MKYIFFDLDNTLTDRKATVSAYAEYFFAEYCDLLNPDVSIEYLKETFNHQDKGGYETHEVRSQIINESEIWKDAVSADELSKHWQSWVPNNSLPMDGLYQCLFELLELEFKLCLVTNGQSKNQRDKIKKLSLEKYFKKNIISEEVGFRKPDIRIFHKALCVMGCNAEEAFFVGDHPLNDYMGSLNAGLVGIWLEGAHQWPDDYPKPVSIKALNELCPLIQKFTIKGKGCENNASRI